MTNDKAKYKLTSNRFSLKMLVSSKTFPTILITTDGGLQCHIGSKTATTLLRRNKHKHL